MTEFSKPTPDERKRFAQEQIRFLKEKGILDSTRLSRIFKAAGPGQIKAAWKLASQPRTQIRKDLLDAILTGGGGSQEFDRGRMEAVLSIAGFEVPEATSDLSFYRILDGAIEILVPNSYEFSDEELVEIEEGVAQNKARSESYRDSIIKEEEDALD